MQMYGVQGEIRCNKKDRQGKGGLEAGKIGDSDSWKKGMVDPSIIH